MEQYWKARGYAYKLVNGDDYVDLVHDAYLDWFYKTGKNLFEESRVTILVAVKYRAKQRWRSRTFEWKYETFQKQYFKVTSEDQTNPEDGNTYAPLSTTTEHEQVEVDHDINVYVRTLSEIQREVFDKLINDEDRVEIAEEFNTSPQVITARVKRLREKYNLINI
jgi:DNA-directed RNA polymerase specialized sigma24 family protein